MTLFPPFLRYIIVRDAEPQSGQWADDSGGKLMGIEFFIFSLIIVGFSLLAGSKDHGLLFEKKLIEAGADLKPLDVDKNQGTLNGIRYRFRAGELQFYFEKHMSSELYVNAYPKEMAFNTAENRSFKKAHTFATAFNSLTPIYVQRPQDLLYFTPAVSEIVAQGKMRIEGKTMYIPLQNGFQMLSSGQGISNEVLSWDFVIMLVETFSKPLTDLAPIWVNMPPSPTREFSLELLADHFHTDPDVIRLAEAQQNSKDMRNQVWAFKVLRQMDPEALRLLLSNRSRDASLFIEAIQDLKSHHPFKRKARQVMINVFENEVVKSEPTVNILKIAKAIIKTSGGLEIFERVAPEVHFSKGQHPLCLALEGQTNAGAEDILLPFLSSDDKGIVYAAAKALESSGGPKSMRALYPLIEKGFNKSSVAKQAEKTMAAIRARHGNLEAGWVSISEGEQLSGALSQPIQNGQLSIKEDSP